MTIARLYLTQVADPELNWRFDVFSIPAATCTVLSGVSWDGPAFRSAEILRGVAHAVVGSTEDIRVEFDGQPLLHDLRLALAAVVRVVRERTATDPWVHRVSDSDISGQFFREIGTPGVATFKEAVIVDHLIAAPILPVERSFPQPTSLGSVLVEAGGGTAATLGVAIAGAPTPWVLIAFPAGVILAAISRGMVGRVRGYFDRDLKQRLRYLLELRDEGLITDDDFNRRRQQVLDDNYGSLGAR